MNVFQKIKLSYQGWMGDWTFRIRMFGFIAVHGKVFLITIISKNLWTLKVSNGKAEKRIDYASTLF